MISDSFILGRTLAFRVSITVLICFALLFIFKLFKARRKIILLQRQGLVSFSIMPHLTSLRKGVVTDCDILQSMPPHHPIFGHLLVLKDVVSKNPSDMHGQLLPNQLQQAFPSLGSVFYVDTWPINAPLLVIASPDAARQITQDHSLPKFAALRGFLRPITGQSDLITMEGEQWKVWRNTFNPGFSAAHMMSLVPSILEETLVFRDILRERALKGEVFPLTETTTNLTMDVIGRVTL